jgi:hypothetical protein
MARFIVAVVFIFLPLLLPVFIRLWTRHSDLHILWIGVVLLLAALAAGTALPERHARTQLQALIMQDLDVDIETARHLDPSTPSVVISMALYLLAWPVSLLAVREEESSDPDEETVEILD